MGIFADRLKQEKTSALQGQPTTTKTGVFADRLRKRREEEARRKAGREALTETTPSLYGRISEAITGKERETEQTRELPEFRETKEVQEFGPKGIANTLKLTAGLLSSFSPESQMDVIKESLPEAQFEKDEKRN